MNIKKILKIIIGVIVFITLPSILFFTFVYFKYNEDLPTGEQGPKADSLAYKMLDALDYSAYKNTDYLEWTFKQRHHYKWDKSKNRCSVFWKDNKVDLDFNNESLHKASIHGFNVEGDIGEELIDKAITYFNNDSFWLVAPYKVFDAGTERRLVSLEKSNQKGLLVTYTQGGSTPGDSYLWVLDKSGMPIGFKMWVSILPIKGLEASWNQWITTETGAKLPTSHNMFFFTIDISNIKTTK